FSRRHAEHWAAAVEAREPGRLAAWLGRLDGEVANVRAAVAWMVERDPDRAIDLVALLFPYWQLRGRSAEARQVLEPLTAACQQAGRCRALVLAASAAYLRNDIGAGTLLIEEALTMRRGQDDQGSAPALRVRGQLAMVSGDLPGAEAAFREALALLRES